MIIEYNKEYVQELIKQAKQEKAREIFRKVNNMHKKCNERFCCLNSEDYKELKKRHLEG